MKHKVSEQVGKLITCVVPKGKAQALLELINDKGYTRFNFSFVRGFDIHDPETSKGLPDQVEKETISLVCKDQAEAEEAFDFIYEHSGIDTLGGGIMYMTNLSGATLYNLPTEI